MPTPHPDFVRRFNEATAGESQAITAHRVGVSQAYISPIKRGLTRPSREIVERIAIAYGGDREEWLNLAGFGGPRESPAERLIRGIAELNERYGAAVEIHLPMSTAQGLTLEDAEKILESAEARMKGR